MKQYTFIITAILFSVLSLAQEQEYFRHNSKLVDDYYTHFDVFGVENGLCNNIIRVIYQDQYGYMWFGTANGLCKFDGYEFTTFRYNPNDSHSLSNNFINDIKEDKNGDLWIATSDGLNKYLRTQNKFEHIFHNDSIENGLKNNQIKSLLLDSSGNFWVDTYEGYLHQFDVDALIFNPYKYQSSASGRYPFYDLFEEQDHIWITTGASNTVSFNKSKHLFTYLKDRDIDLVKYKDRNGRFDSHTSFIKDKYGNFYWGNSNNYGTLYKPDENVITSLGIPSIFCMQKDKQNRIWYGGYGSGLSLYDPQKNTITRYKPDDNNLHSIPDLQIWSLFIDKNDNLWIGTKNGLAKLSPDKNRFTNWKHFANNLNTIASDNVLDVIQTQDSNIWVASFSGLDCYHHQTRKMEHFKNDPFNPNSLLSNRVRVLFEDSAENLWIGLWAGLGFDKFDKRKRIFQHFKMNSDPKVSGDDWYNAFIEDQNQRFYPIQWSAARIVEFDRKQEKYTTNVYGGPSMNVISQERNLYFFRQKLWFNNCFYLHDFISHHTQHIVPSEYKAPHSLHEVFNDKRYYQYSDIAVETFINETTSCNDILYFGANNGLYFYDETAEIVKKITSKIKNINRIISAGIKNYLWIGASDGLYLVDPDNENIILNISDIDTKNIISYQKITALLFDGQNILWIGTPKGLYQLKILSLEDKEFDLVKLVSGLSNEYITDLAQTADNLLWIGTEEGLNTIKANGDKHTYKTTNSSVSDDYIHDLYVDSKGELWIATQEGFNHYLSEANTFESWKHDLMNPKTLSNNMVFIITENDHNQLFLGTGKGICKFDIATKTIERYDEAEDYNIDGALLTCGLVDYKNDIWLGNGNHGNSLSRINQKTKKVKHYIDRPYDSSSYKGTVAYFIFEDSKKNIWVGSDKGLNKFDDKTEKFQLYTTDDGLPNNNVVGILEDGKGNLWLSTQGGLAKFNESESSFQIYDTNDGIASDGFNPGAFTKLFSGHMAFGGNKGITIFHPDSIKAQLSVPNLSLNHFFIYDSLAFTDLSEVSSIQLNHQQNNFRIEFSVLDFVNPQQNKYAYQLKGYDKDWIYTDYKDRKAKYTDLPYGNYTFLLKASNHDGYWSNEVKKLEISILPPWYQTKIAYAFYLLVFLGFSFLIGTVRIRLVKKRNKELEAEIAKRTEEILQKNEEINQQEISEVIKEHHIQNMKERFSGQEEERKRISRELHDGIAGNLTGIKLFLENLNQEFKGSKRDLLIKDIDRLYNEVRNISHDLLPPEFQDTSIREVLQFYIEQLVIRSELNIAISFHPLIGWQDLDKNIQIEIYRIVQELTQNAIKHAECQNIEIEIVKHSENLTIMAEDDGKGMEVMQKKMGIGLKSLYQRITSQGGKMNIDSKPGRGTVIDMELPL